jgi:hypothetical protein
MKGMRGKCKTKKREETGGIEGIFIAKSQPLMASTFSLCQLSKDRAVAKGRQTQL